MEDGSWPRIDPVNYMVQILLKGQIQAYCLTFFNIARESVLLIFFLSRLSSSSQGIMHGSWWKKSGIFKWMVSMIEYNLKQVLDLLSLNYG